MLAFNVNLGFAHSSVHDHANNLIYFYGGLNININSPPTQSHPNMTFDPVRTFKRKFLQKPTNFDRRPQMSAMLYVYNINKLEWKELASSALASYMHTSVFYNNLILNYGGVTMDPQVGQDSFHLSNSLRLFDINRNMWHDELTNGQHSAVNLKHRQRYAHSSFIYNESLYVFAGFNGFFLRDLFRLELATFKVQNCTEACKDPLKSITKRQEQIGSTYFLDKSPTPEKLFLGTIESCGLYTSCQRCHSNLNCIWNMRKCEYYSATSLASLLSQPDLKAVESSRVIYKKPSCPHMCTELSDCLNCTQSAECVWCSTSFTCILQSAAHVYFPFGECTRLVGDPAQCESRVERKTTGHFFKKFELTSLNESVSLCALYFTNCTACTRDERCGWCSSDSLNDTLSANNTGHGTCMEGSNSGSNEHACPHNWHFVPSSCPACECNGHSTCLANSNVCQHCANNTSGAECDECSPGHYGYPENNGVCTACNCGPNSNMCDSRSGRCFCNTKGVIGAKCDRCESPRYSGLPSLPDGSCYYNLSTDYQFTFNLNKAADRFYTRINFVNQLMYDNDDDIDFTIRCYKSNALFNISYVVDYGADDGGGLSANVEWSLNFINNLTSSLLSYRNNKSQSVFVGKNSIMRGSSNKFNYHFGSDLARTVLLTQMNCTFGDFKYTFSHQELRQKRNATFVVHVYEFEVPITIQISFSRRSRIQLLHFFITFFGCLFSLLVIAFVTWKSKQRYDHYRHQRQIIIQMEHMASRPFTKLLIDVTKIQSQDKAVIPPTPTPMLPLVEPAALHNSKKISRICKINKKINTKKYQQGKINNEVTAIEGVEQINGGCEAAYKLCKVMPVAVEPLNNNKAAVLTCILKLPQGGLSYTPKGSSPLVLASAYVQINSTSSFSKPYLNDNQDTIMDDDDDEHDNEDDNLSAGNKEREKSEIV